MQIITSIVLQGCLLGLAFIVICLRCWIRIRSEHRTLTLPDYLVWGGWIFAVGWVACSVRALNIQIEHPLAEDTTSDSIEYLKIVFLASYLFDIGMFFPKASLICFYWWLVPHGFKRLRIAVYFGTAFIACTFFATMLTDTLVAPKFSDNWSLENQLNSTWNSYTAFVVDWALNIATDILLFALPFFIINCLKLRRTQKIGLVGVFSLGLITMAISLSRFIAYTASNYDIDDASGNAWCTAEICTAIIVVSLPSLKSLITRASPTPTARSTNGYIQTGSGKPYSHGRETGRSSHIRGGDMDDEVELVFLDRKPSPAFTGTTSGTGKEDAKDAVMVTTNVTITRDVV